MTVRQMGILIKNKEFMYQNLDRIIRNDDMNVSLVLSQFSYSAQFFFRREPSIKKLIFSGKSVLNNKVLEENNSLNLLQLFSHSY